MAIRQLKKKKPQVCLVLQGGGALGAYHIGAYKALEEAGFTPDWFAGISIGALNSAILAGNEPKDRLEQLESFWDKISRPETDVHLPPSMATMFNTLTATQSLMFGQPNFFTPRLINPWLAPAGEAATSFYDTAPLYGTLNELVNFERINQKKSRLTVGATRVTDGELVFFDSESTKFSAAHPIASGSLPPGFPATKIDGDYYWDGGVVSNTPLNGLLKLAGDEDLLIFMVDLWNAKGEMPDTMNHVLWREKEIQYASRTNAHLEAIVAKHNLSHVLSQGPAALQPDQDGTSFRIGKKIDIVHITFSPLQGYIQLSDAEFSRRSIRLRSERGYEDMKQAILESPWTQANDGLPCQFHRRHNHGSWLTCKKEIKKLNKAS